MNNRIIMPRGGTRRGVGNFTANADLRFDDAVLAEGTASRIANFDVTSGALTDGYGVETSPLFEGLTGQAAWRFTRYDYDAEEYKTCDMYCDQSGAVWYNYGAGWRELSGVKFTSAPAAVGYRLYGDDSVLMTSPTDKMYVWDGVGAARRVDDSPYVTSMAMHYERMFATTTGESNAVYFSDDLDPTNWNDSDLTEGGYIRLLDERGRLLKVVDFLNYVYVFREYGISRLTAYAAQEDFSVVNLYVAGGRIYGGSVCACGDTVLMLASDGLHSFDGYAVRNKLRAVKFAPSPHASAVFADGKYYLAACTGGGEANDTLIVYDLASGTFALSRLAITRLEQLAGEVYAVTADGRIGKVSKCGALFGEPLDKLWESGTLDFGTPVKKTVREVSVVSDGPAELTVTADNVSRTFALGGGVTRVKPTLTGRTIKFGIKSSAVGARIVRLSYLLRR